MTDRPNGSDILDQVEASLHRYVILPSAEAAVAVTLWIAATHAAPAWNTAARLVIRAPEKRCGKSRLLDVIEAICHRPVMTVNASPAAIYRLIGNSQGDPPTVLIDEADTIFGPGSGDHEDLRGLLNAGHQRGRPALRWDVNTRTVEELDTYAMAALAGIGRLPDTIEDRAVVIKMRRRAPGEHVHPYRLRRDSPPLNKLRAQLHRWARAHSDQLTKAVPTMPLEDRAADTWEALIVIADHAGGAWPDLARSAALVLVDDAIESEEENIATLLLADCRTAFAGRTIIRTDELLSTLKNDPEKPWATQGPNGLTARALAKVLKEFGIRSRQLTFGGTQLRGYAADGPFLDAWNRYLSPTPESSVISVNPSESLVRGRPGRDGSDAPDASAPDPSIVSPSKPDRPNATQRDHNVIPIRHRPPDPSASVSRSPGGMTE